MAIMPSKNPRVGTDAYFREALDVRRHCWPVLDEQLRPVYLVGCGAATTVGKNAPTTAAAVRAGLCLFRTSYMVDRAGEPIVLSIADYVDECAYGVDRFAKLGLPAALEALTPVAEYTRDENSVPRIGFCLGLPLDRPGFDPALGAELLTRFKIKLDLEISATHEYIIREGHASVFYGFAAAARWLSIGELDLVLVGGVDSYYEPDTLEWLDSIKRLHSEANNDGFVPGEGAGFCLLASQEYVNNNHIRPLATVLAANTGEEPNPYFSDGICIGQGLTEVLNKTLSDSNSDKRVADSTICDLNGESFRAKEWVFAYLRTGKKHRDPLELCHPADCLGDLGAASGAVFTCIVVASWEKGYARGNRVLLWTASDGPERAAVFLQRHS